MKLQILDSVETELGTLLLRRRESPSLGEVFEVTLDGEFLMSSVVNDTELALADRALATCDGDDLEVCVGGLGLGCTAARALDDTRVARVDVVELLAPVLQWHKAHVVPLGARLTEDARCTFVHADFFEWVQAQDRAFDAILIDIDHSPEFLLHPRNAAFWDGAGFDALARAVRPGGVLALWSADAPTDDFLGRFRRAFSSVESQAIEFDVPQLDFVDCNWIVLASNEAQSKP